MANRTCYKCNKIIGESPSSVGYYIADSRNEKGNFNFICHGCVVYLDINLFSKPMLNHIKHFYTCETKLEDSKMIQWFINKMHEKCRKDREELNC